MAYPAGIADIQVDPDVSSSSDYDSIRSDLTSLTESIYSYIYENGRTYHAYRSGSYFLPNDEREQDRLDVLHHVFRLLHNGELCQTELEHPQRILDIGTGTGIWAIEIADQFPGAEVIGVDLSPIQPGWVPPNVRFVIEDINQPEWSFAEGSFDFIHVRCLAGCVDDWPTFLSRCYNHLRPGGRIEVTECYPHLECDDDSWPKDSRLRTWETEFHRIAGIQGRVWDLSLSLKDLLGEAGLGYRCAGMFDSGGNLAKGSQTEGNWALFSCSVCRWSSRKLLACPVYAVWAVDICRGPSSTGSAESRASHEQNACLFSSGIWDGSEATITAEMTTPVERERGNDL